MKVIVQLLSGPKKCWTEIIHKTVLSSHENVSIFSSVIRTVEKDCPTAPKTNKLYLKTVQWEHNYY